MSWGPTVEKPKVHGFGRLGSVDALNHRLLAARQRAAAVLNLALREAEQDGRQVWESPGIAQERALVAEALALLLRRHEDPAAERELARTESLHRLGQQLLSREERRAMRQGLEEEQVHQMAVVLS